MRIIKEYLTDLVRCYANAPLMLEGKLHYLFASELDAPCYAFDAVTLERSTIWEHPGGCMSIIPLSDREGEFLAIENFRPRMMAPDTRIIRARRDSEGTWHSSVLARQGYIHRFDVLEGDRKYLLVCTIASHKDCLEDWSCPGKLWVAPLPDDLSETVGLKPLLRGLTKNHGYSRVNWKGCQAGLVSCDSGVLAVTPPQHENDQWHIETLLERPVGDIALLDIDSDGQDELACIEPFHGDSFTINKLIDGTWQQVWRYDGDFRVGHVVWGGAIRGRPAFIGGAREGAGELFLVRCESSSPLRFSCTVLDAGKGPANVSVVSGGDEDVILVSNREVGQAWLYRLRDE